MPRASRPTLERLESRSLLSVSPAGLPAPVTLSFDSPPLASQLATSERLTLTRSSPVTSKMGTLRVRVSTATAPPALTAAPSAVPGVQYEPVDEVVTFPPGVSSEPVTIPIVAGAANPGAVGFEVDASTIAGDAVKAPAPASTEAVVSIEADAPEVISGRLVAQGKKASGIVLKFNEPMDPATVDDVAAYSIEDTPGHTDLVGVLDLLFGKYSSTPVPIAIGSATYNPADESMMLAFRKPEPAGDYYQAGEGSYRHGQAPPTLDDAEGHPIVDPDDGAPGLFGVMV